MVNTLYEHALRIRRGKHGSPGVPLVPMEFCPSNGPSTHCDLLYWRRKLLRKARTSGNMSQPHHCKQTSLCFCLRRPGSDCEVKLGTKTEATATTLPSDYGQPCFGLWDLQLRHSHPSLLRFSHTVGDGCGQETGPQNLLD